MGIDRYEMKKPRGFQRHIRRVEGWLSDHSRMNRLLTQATAKLKSKFKSPSDIRNDLTDFIGLVKAYINGEYRDVSYKVILWTAAGILYFVNPFDVIPDFIPASGLLDDIGVVQFVLSKYSAEIKKYRTYRLQNEKETSEDASES